MVQINFSLKEVNCKVVYYGPGLSGKTTNLEVVHQKAPAASVGELTSIATEGDRTLFFDFLPLNLGQVAGMKTKFQIYTVPGQVYYNSTRKLVLQGSDGIVFVADSKRGKINENKESLNNLVENLQEYGMDITTTPVVMQYNKRDLPDVYTVEELNQQINPWGFPYFEAVARDGTGVFPTLKHLAGMVLESLNKQHGGGGRSAAPRPARPAPSAPASVGTGGAAPAPTSAGPAVATMPPPPRPAVGVRPSPVAPAAAARKATPALVGDPRQIPQPQTTPEKKSGNRGMLVAAGLILLLAAAAAGAHFTGLLENILK